jgi:hypothetical protein
VNLLSKKKKHDLSYDFSIKSVFGFLRFKCFWNFNNFKNYFKSFNKKIEVKKDLVVTFYSAFSPPGGF